MQAHTLAEALGRTLFQPVRIHLNVGPPVEVPVPYLSFMDGETLHVAMATRADQRHDARVHLIAAADVLRVELAGMESLEA